MGPHAPKWSLCQPVRSATLTLFCRGGALSTRAGRSGALAALPLRVWSLAPAASAVPAGGGSDCASFTPASLLVSCAASELEWPLDRLSGLLWRVVVDSGMDCVRAGERPPASARTPPGTVDDRRDDLDMRLFK